MKQWCVNDIPFRLQRKPYKPWTVQKCLRNLIYDWDTIKSSFTQIRQALTMFSTHTRLKQYKCLIFGLSSASEQYQYVIQETLQGIAGARNISDDIKLYSAKIRNRTTAVCKRLSNGLKSLGSLWRKKSAFSASPSCFSSVSRFQQLAFLLTIKLKPHRMLAPLKILAKYKAS